MLDFGKPIQDLTEDDLQERLIQDEYRECLWAEYKRQFPEPPEKLATTLAAFANQYGGWVFVGVDADDENKPTKLRGICRRGQATERLANIAAAHVGPVPPFVPQWVELRESKRGVLVVRVWEGADTPYVLRKTGKIYVRIADTNQPNDQVKDRSGIERLFRKAREAGRRFGEARRRTYYTRAIGRDAPWATSLASRPMLISAQVHPRIGEERLVAPLFTESWEAVLEDLHFRLFRTPPAGCRHEQFRVVCIGGSEAVEEWPPVLFAVAVDGSVEWTELFGSGEHGAHLTEDDFRGVAQRGLRTAATVYDRISYGGMVELRLEAGPFRGRSLEAQPQGLPAEKRMFPAPENSFCSVRRAAAADLPDTEKGGRVIDGLLRDVRRFFRCTTYD
ncbi:MAG: ATP-binding protein [Armatimonadota bacterium]|jgi:hypothetical protein